jgi:hypothetical protein
MRAANGEGFLRAQQIMQGDDASRFVAGFQNRKPTRSIDQQARHLADGEATAAGRGLF